MSQSRVSPNNLSRVQPWSGETGPGRQVRGDKSGEAGCGDRPDETGWVRDRSGGDRAGETGPGRHVEAGWGRQGRGDRAEDGVTGPEYSSRRSTAAGRPCQDDFNTKYQIG